MDSFHELELEPELIEALAAEGIERPTALQRVAIPPLRRGTSCVLQAAPGAGLLAAYGIPLLDRFEPGQDQPAAIVLTSSRARASALALSLARLALGTGHRVAALGGPWAEAETADIVFAAPGDLKSSLHSAGVKLDEVECLVLEEAESLLEAPHAELLTSVLNAIPEGPPQLVVVSDGLGPAVRGWVEAHAKRAVFIPPAAAGGESPTAPTTRGTLRVHASDLPMEDVVPKLVSDLLEEGCPHVLVYARTADQAADLGDFLGLHGFVAGRPGQPDAPVWLGVEPLEARDAIGETGLSFAVLSTDPPADADEMDRRHGGSARAGSVLAPPRALPHLRRVAREAGYVLQFPADSPAHRDEAEAFVARIESALTEEDLVPYLLLLEPAIRKWGAAEVAATLAGLLRKKSPGPAGPDAEDTGSPFEPTASPSRPPAWARLFLSVGRRDGVGARDLLGAIVGESGVTADQVGRIDVKDAFSRVEVHDSVAERVIRALNGTSIRGRSVRADFDREDARGKRRPGSGRRGRERDRGPAGNRGHPGKGRPGGSSAAGR